MVPCNSKPQTPLRLEPEKQAEVFENCDEQLSHFFFLLLDAAVEGGKQDGP